MSSARTQKEHQRGVSYFESVTYFEEN
jgi:hypothetical protein